MIRRLKILAAGIICLALLAGMASAEVTAKETEEKGKVTRVVWQDAAGNAAAGPEGYAEVRYSYKGSDTTEQYFNADGTPYRTAGGYYGRTVTRNGKKQITAILYLDASGKATLNSMGYAQVKMTYTSFGGVGLVTYYGLNKKAVTVPSLGYASINTQYSSKMIVDRTWKDEKGNPVENGQGYAIMKQKLNKQYQVIRTRYYHADGSPALCPDRWSLRVQDRDEKGRVISIRYYDTEEQLTNRGAGYAREDISYPGNDEERVIRFDAAGNRVAFYGNAFALLRRIKDERIVSETYFDADGNETEGPAGVCTVVYGYDHLGRVETVKYQNAAKESVLCSLGYAGYRDIRDEDGAVTSRTYLGIDGNPMEIPGGYCEERYVYDITKQLTDVRKYDLNGNAVK